MSLLVGGCAAYESTDWSGILPSEAHIRPWIYAQPAETCTAGDAERLLGPRATVARAYGLREMARARLRGQDQAAGEMLVEVMSFDSPTDAFGYYSRDRSRAGKAEIEPNLATQGFSRPDLMECWAGNHVLRCWSDADRTGLWPTRIWILNMILDRLPGGRRKDWPAELALFPPEGLRANSQQLARPAVLEQDFLGEGWLACYKYVGLEYHLALIPSSTEFPQGAQVRLRRLKERLGEFGTLCELPAGLSNEAVAGREAGIGQVVADRVDSWIVMTINCPDSAEAARAILAAGARIRNGGRQAPAG